MGFLILDPPFEVYRKAAAMEEWLSELDQMAVEYANDPETTAQLRQEREYAASILSKLREQGDAEGEDDDEISLDE